MPERPLTDRLTDTLHYSLGLGLEETLLVVTTEAMRPVSEELKIAKLGKKYFEASSQSIGQHELLTYENDQGVVVAELVLKGERPFSGKDVRVFNEVLDLMPDVQGVVGIYERVIGKNELDFRIAASNTFQNRPVKYAHIPAWDPKSTLEGWDKLLPDNIEDMTQKAELGKKHFSQTGLIGLHFQGENGTDYVHFINQRTKWNNDITCDIDKKRISGVQWPCGELYDENEVKDKRTPSGERLEIRRGYGVWVGDMSIGNLQEEDGEPLELEPRKARATFYVGLTDKKEISLDEIGLMTQIVVEENENTVYLTRKDFEQKTYVPGESRVANEIYRVLSEGDETVNAAAEPIYVQEVAIAFNEEANPKSKYLIEGEKAAPHAAIGPITGHMDFVTDPNGITVTAMVLKEEYRDRIDDSEFMERILTDKTLWEEHLEMKEIYQNGNFAPL